MVSMGFFNKFVFFFIFSFFRNVFTEAASNPRPFSNNVSAVLVFGDSTVDSGNNNYINTLFKGNFLPYGKDFPGHPATGRLSNGRLVTDFGASYVGVKDFVPPYLDPTLSIEEMLSGVCFASAGSGFDPFTAQINNVISMQKQVENYREYKKKLELAIGRERMEDHIKRAIFVVSAGTNDFGFNYFAVPVRRNSYSISEFQQFILQCFKTFIQDLWEEGAWKIAVAGLPPLGCIPALITLFSGSPILRRGCLDEYSQVARKYNMMLLKELNLMQNKLANQGAKIYYIDLYNPLLDLIQGKEKSEFDVVSYGCCGTGYVEAGPLCNPSSNLCPNASKYVFFDSLHPTEKTYYKMFESALGVINILIKD